jgi:hypothetical protein
MALLGVPSEASRITLHFRACNCGVLPARASDSNICFCEEFKASASAGMNKPHYITSSAYCKPL